MYKISILILAIFAANCTSNKDEIVREHKIEFRLAEQAPGDAYMEYQFRHYDKKFYLHKETLINNDDLQSAKVIELNDEFAVQITFNESGKTKWAEVTENNIGKNIAMLVDDELVTCPLIQAKIDKGIAIINGGFSKTEAGEIAKGIKNK